MMTQTRGMKLGAIATDGQLPLFLTKEGGAISFL
jgi:hypothetical protein